jgi:hypothetical protein
MVKDEAQARRKGRLPDLEQGPVHGVQGSDLSGPSVFASGYDRALHRRTATAAHFTICGHLVGRAK